VQWVAHGLKKREAYQILFTVWLAPLGSNVNLFAQRFSCHGMPHSASRHNHAHGQITRLTMIDVGERTRARTHSCTSQRVPVRVGMACRHRMRMKKVECIGSVKCEGQQRQTER
jgi:hypothetical protein